jgi:hypothetical protein
MRDASCEAGKDSTTGAIWKVPPLDVAAKSSKEFEIDVRPTDVDADNEMEWDDCGVNETMAADLGKRLLAEVEEVGLDEVGHMFQPSNRERMEVNWPIDQILTIPNLLDSDFQRWTKSSMPPSSTKPTLQPSRQYSKSHPKHQEAVQRTSSTCSPRPQSSPPI